MQKSQTLGLEESKAFWITQDYAAYSEDEHRLWSELAGRRMAQLEGCACREYLEGWRQLGMAGERIPRLEDVSRRVEARTGWRVQPVSGFMPSRAFFGMLEARLFPATTWLRSRASADYTPEPDMLHDALGHLPMFAEPGFADAVEEYGRVCSAMEGEEKLERMGRLYWYTFEFGLIREGGGVKVYGSGVASSQAECENVLNGGCAVEDFTVERVLATSVKVDEVHKKLFAIRGFDEILGAVKEARRLVENAG
jgi:phenylalanine-4-hydroxylase